MFEDKRFDFAINDKFVERYVKDPGVTDHALALRRFTFDTLGDTRATPDSPKLVSSNLGYIGQILLTIPGWIFTDPPQSRDGYKDVYTDLLPKLPQDAEIVILTNESAETECRQWIDDLGLSARTTIGAAPDTIGFSIWAEDAYCIANDATDGEKFFLESVAFTRYDDEHIADEVVNFTNLDLSMVNLYFQGGNVLIGDDFWMIGLDYPNNSFRLGYITQNAGESRMDAIRRAYGTAMDHDRTLHPIGSRLSVPSETRVPVNFGGEEWNSVVYRGNMEGTTQPLFHIDMFITPLGRSENGKPLLMLADPSMAAEILAGVDYIEYAKQFSMVPVFNDIERQLVDLGFDVVRNPLPSAFAPIESVKELRWYFATANNALVQIDGDEKDIWLPQYGFAPFPELSATDDRTVEILENLGFRTHRLGNFHPFAYGLGAVHCITKYLHRGKLDRTS